MALLRWVIGGTPHAKKRLRASVGGGGALLLLTPSAQFDFSCKKLLNKNWAGLVAGSKGSLERARVAVLSKECCCVCREEVAAAGCGESRSCCCSSVDCSAARRPPGGSEPH